MTAYPVQETARTCSIFVGMSAINRDLSLISRPFSVVEYDFTHLIGNPKPQTIQRDLRCGQNRINSLQVVFNLSIPQCNQS